MKNRSFAEVTKRLAMRNLSLVSPGNDYLSNHSKSQSGFICHYLLCEWPKQSEDLDMGSS